MLTIIFCLNLLRVTFPFFQLFSKKASLQILLIGYLFWIDYMADPEKPIPPLVTVVKPTPINPYQIWRDRYTDELVENLADAERQAFVEAAREDDERQQEQPTEIMSSDDETVFGEVREQASRLQSSRSNDRRTKMKAPKKRQLAKKSDIQFILNAIANIKAAVKYMLDTKIQNNVVAVSSQSFSDLSYDDIFQRKTITAEDMEYLRVRETTEDILIRIDAAINSRPEFQWFPKIVLSAEQIHSMELKQIALADQATAAHEICSRILTRRKESTEKEIVTRITNESQAKAEARQIESQAKAALRKQANDAKVLERKQLIADAKASEEGKRKAANARPVHRNQVVSLSAQPKERRSGSTSQFQMPKETAHPRTERTVTVESLAETVHVQRTQPTECLAVASPNVSAQEVSPRCSSDKINSQCKETVKEIPDEATEKQTTLPVQIFDAIGAEGLRSDNGDNMGVNPTSQDADHLQTAKSEFASTTSAVIGKRKREHYTPTQLQIGAKVKAILLRILRRLEVAKDTVKLNKTSRRSSNIDNFSTTLEQEILAELQHSCYGSHYSALPDIFDIEVSTNMGTWNFSNAHDRIEFLREFSDSLYRHLQGCASANNKALFQIVNEILL